MTPKEKAKELIKKVSAFKWATYPRRKKVSLLIVEEILEADKNVRWDDAAAWKENFDFWNKVKEEIQKL
jgi:hypothetical protein